MVKVSESVQERSDPFLVAEHTALDALNSCCAPWGEEIEWWDTGSGFLNWLVSAGLIDDEVAAIMAEVPVAKLDQIATQARDLREKFRRVIANYADHSFDVDSNQDIARLNTLLEKDKRFLKLVPNEFGQIKLTWQRHWKRPEQLLFPLAEQMAELLSSENMSLVKCCEWPPCTLWFLDTTKNKKRRWCSMQVCGNRAKAAAHRAKKKKV